MHDSPKFTQNSILLLLQSVQDSKRHDTPNHVRVRLDWASPVRLSLLLRRVVLPHLLA